MRSPLRVDIARPHTYYQTRTYLDFSWKNKQESSAACFWVLEIVILQPQGREGQALEVKHETFS